MGACRVVTLDALRNIRAVYNTSNPGLSAALDIALDASDNLIISDWNRNRVIKLSTINNSVLLVYNVSSITNPTLCSSRGVATDSTDNVYISYAGSSRVVKMGPVGNVLMMYSSPFPTAVVADSSGNLLLNSATGDVVYTVNSSSSSSHNAHFVYNTTTTPWG